MVPVCRSTWAGVWLDSVGTGKQILCSGRLTALWLRSVRQWNKDNEDRQGLTIQLATTACRPTASASPREPPGQIEQAMRLPRSRPADSTIRYMRLR